MNLDKHYKALAIEPQTIIDEHGLDFYSGSILGYVSRLYLIERDVPIYEHLQKCLFHFDKIINLFEERIFAHHPVGLTDSIITYIEYNKLNIYQAQILTYCFAGIEHNISGGIENAKEITKEFINKLK